MVSQRLSLTGLLFTADNGCKQQTGCFMHKPNYTLAYRQNGSGRTLDHLMFQYIIFNSDIHGPVHRR
jgi:hypothetical protein